MVTNSLIIKPKDKILVIAPHPDDESIGVGGLIAKYPNQTKVIVMTDGRYGNDKYNPSDMVDMRKHEFCTAMEIADQNDYVLYNVEDGTLIRHKSVFEAIDLKGYTHIFLPNPNDNHSDHFACYAFIFELIKGKQIYKPKVFQYEVHTPLANIDYHIDITSVIQKKKQMVEAYASQLEKHDYSKQILFLAQYRGIQNEQADRCLEVYHEVDVNKSLVGDLGIEIEAAKYKEFTKLLTKWLYIEAKQSRLGDILCQKGFRSVAIYGYGVLGKILYQLLLQSRCKISCCIDKNKTIQLEVPTYRDLSHVIETDLIIVTTIGMYDEIANEIADQCTCKAISFETLLEMVKDA